MKKEEEKKPHVKKPLNAFMLYMKEMRAKVVAECTLKESAAINQILGRKVRPALGLQAVRLSGPHAHRSVIAGPLSRSGTTCPEKNRPSTMNWPGRSGSFTRSSTRPGQPETTTYVPIRHQEQPLREEEGQRKLTPLIEDPVNGVSFQGGQGEVCISLEIRKTF